MSARPRALLATPHYWTSAFQVGGHHFARALVSEGWDVAFVSNPVSPLHILGGRSAQLSERIALWRHGGLDDLDGSLWAYVPGALATPHRGPVLDSAWLHRHWDRLTLPNVVRKASKHGFGRVDLLYVDTVVQGFWLDAIEHRRSVLRIGDRMAAFSAVTREMQRYEGDLARRVDLVAYTATTLVDHVNELRPRRTLHLPNGVDVAHFLGPEPPTPAGLASIPRPIAIYVGAMDEWFDFDTVAAVADRMPKVSVVLIGPDEAARRRLARRPNLHVLGRRPYAELPRYLRHADVGMIPFDVRRHPDLVNSVHPLKLYEYLACGLPVVATRWAELESLDSPAILSDGSDGFVAGVERALSEPFDRDAAIDFARTADWRHRVTGLLEALG